MGLDIESDILWYVMVIFYSSSLITRNNHSSLHLSQSLIVSLNSTFLFSLGNWGGCSLLPPGQSMGLVASALTGKGKETDTDTDANEVAAIVAAVERHVNKLACTWVYRLRSYTEHAQTNLCKHV